MYSNLEPTSQPKSPPEKSHHLSAIKTVRKPVNVMNPKRQKGNEKGKKPKEGI